MLENENFNKLNDNLSTKTNIKQILSKSISNREDLNKNKAENKWTKMLLTFFATINSIDNSIEKIRSKLNILNNFSSSNLFNYLDKSSKKYLTLNDFKFFLQSNKFPFSEKNLRQFIHNFDKDSDFSLNYKEFLGIISPKIVKPKVEEKDLILSQEGEKEIVIDEEIKKVFGELIVEELKFVEKSYELSQNIRNSKEFTTYEAFTEIVGEEKYINLENLGNYIKNKGLNMTDPEISQLMFRIDSDNDGKISYEEFKEIFLPLNAINFNYKENNSFLNYLNDNKNDSKDKYEFKYGKKENSYKLDLPLKMTNLNIHKININANKENNKNAINIKQRYNYNFNLEENEMKDNKIKYENKDIPSISCSPYDDILKYDKSVIIEPQNKDKENNKNKIYDIKIGQRNFSGFELNRSKSLDIYHNKSKNYLINETQSILNYNSNVQNKNIDIKNDYKTVNNNYNIKSPIIIKENIEQKNDKNKGEKFLDTYLNFDYSRYTNKDKDNGQYYFKKNNKNNLTENLGINKYEENKNNSNNIKKYFNKYELDKSDYLKNNNIGKNYNNSDKILNNDSIKRGLNKYKYIIEDEENIYQNNIINIKNKKINTPLNHYKIMNNYNNYINNNNQYRKILNYKKNLLKNYTSNININKNNLEEQYLDSLEDSEGIKNSKFNKIKTKNKYHYNTKLTRNIQDQILDRNNSYNINNNMNNTMTIFNYNKKDDKNNLNIYKTYFAKEKKDNQNRSFILSNYNNKNNFLNNKFNIENNSYNKINKKDFDNKFDDITFSSNRCPKCRCMKEIEEENKFEMYNKNSNNKNRNYNHHSSLPKNIFKKPNNLHLNYSNSSNTNSFYLESCSQNNNFIINKLNNKKYNINKKNKEFILDDSQFSSFYNLLLDFIRQDNAIAKIRQSLSLKEDVNLTDLFELFDNSSNNLISSMDFLNTLKELGLYLKNDEIKYLFRKFNKNLNENFEFEEFCEILLPKKCSSAKIMNEKQSNEYYYEISEDTKNIICMLFKNIIEGEKSIENYRKIIGKSGEYSGFELFNKIKKNYSIGIYKEDIANFMKKNKYKISNGDIELLMERFDKNKDGMIDFKEFLNEISPMAD